MPPSATLRDVLPERAPELIQQFEDELRTAIREGGRAIFVVDRDAAALDRYLDAVRERAVLVSSRIRIVRLAAREAAGAPGGLWSVLAHRMTMQRRTQRFLRKVAPEWLDVIPVVGKALHAVVATWEARAARKDSRARKRLRRLVQGRTNSAAHGVRMLLDIAPKEPRLVLVTGFEQATTTDLAGTAALVRALPELRLLLVCACVAGSDGRLPADVAGLIAEAERNRTGKRVRLRTHAAPTGEFRHAVALDQLDEVSLELLRLGAIQGETFYSVVVAALAGIAELDGEERLDALARRGLIDAVKDAAVDEAVTSVYRFSDGLAERLNATTDAVAAEQTAARYHELRERLGLPAAPGAPLPTA